jgi:hypothetical protein
LVHARKRIYEQAPGFCEKAYTTPFLVQATLPHRQPRNNPPEWCRRNGDYVFSIRPGYATDRNTGMRYCVGYPAGTLPRLLLMWIVTEVKQGRGPKLFLGDSLSDFMRELALNPRNGRGPRSDARRLELEMRRLFSATITFEYTTLEVQRYRDMLIAPDRELWWDAHDPNRPLLWKSWIQLGRQFYEAIKANPFPVDIRALHALKSSPLALDFYVWATYKTFAVNHRGKSQAIPWVLLQEQLGTGYTRTRDFRRHATRALREVSTVYSGFRYSVNEQIVVVYPGETAVAG